MQRVLISRIPEDLPPSVIRILKDAPIYDSSCSETARVYFIDRDEGFFLKTAPGGTLREEAILNDFFHSLKLGPRMLAYESGPRDFLLTARIPGEDCLQPEYLADPNRLCDVLGQTLRSLHDTPVAGCPVIRPVPDPVALSRDGIPEFHPRRYLGRNPFPTPEQAWQLLSEAAPGLGPEVLIHGDFCLPNILLQAWQFSGFIDVGGGGLGSRYTDLFWGLWSLCYNLKTDRYSTRFLDAYGRDKIDPELLLAAAALEGFL